MPPVKILVGLVMMLLAIAGGILGTYNHIRNAQGPRERSFAIRMLAVCWLFVASMLAAIYLTEGRNRVLVLAFYFVVCPVLFYKWSTKLQLIRILDRRDDDEKERT